MFLSGLLGTALIVWLLRGRQIRREALSRSEALYRSLISDVLDTFRVGIIILDAKRRVVWRNEAFSVYFGLPASTLLNADIRAVVRDRMGEGVVEDPESFFRNVFARPRPVSQPYEFRVLPGTLRQERWLEHHSQRIESGLFAGGRIDHFYDITLRKAAAAEQSRLLARERDLQNQLRQAQRIDAVGKLAGGVAHDFNNILQVILGRAHQLLAGQERGSREAESLIEVIEASEKASGLTRQLLAFGRRQNLQRSALDPNRLVKDHVKMLRRLIGEDIDLVLEYGKDVGYVRADQTQLEQVLMNLCVNARDAMPDGGRITIATEACRQVEAPLAKTPNVEPEESFVKISVADTGMGIPPEHLDRVCEPFFSTKTPGQGSGLGLSTVYGIVRQHDGFVEIESVVGFGTTIDVYIPATDEAGLEPSEIQSEAAMEGTETVLLVEDNPGVRELAVESLEDAGYTVLTAKDGEDALERLLASSGAVDLLFSDVVMPNMGGVALVNAVRERGYGLRVLLTSGHGEEDRYASLGAAFIEKPYAPSALLQRVREVLDA